MVRDTKKSLSITSITRGRNEYTDFDYLHKLSDEDKAWLGRFSDEYYGASFQINPTYVIKKDFIPHMELMIQRELNEDKIVKFQRQVDHYSKTKGKYIQISDHPDKWMNVDLRKVRAISKFYRKPDGKLTDNTDYKYSPDNIHTKPQLKPCNDCSNAMQRDVIGNCLRTEAVYDNDFDTMLENIECVELSAEEQLLYEELRLEVEKLEDLD